MSNKNPDYKIQFDDSIPEDEQLEILERINNARQVFFMDTKVFFPDELDDDNQVKSIGGVKLTVKDLENETTKDI